VPEPICLYLRHKKMLYDDPRRPPTEEEREVERLFGTCDTTMCWCELTQTGRGPDDQPANRTACSRVERSCYKGLRNLTEV
jgi:hypothetical protein